MAQRIYQVIKRWWADVLGTRDYFRYLEKEDRKRRLAGQFFTFITIVLGIFYLLWHARHINWDVTYYSFIFFLAEVICLFLFSFFAFNAWFLRFHSPKGVDLEKPFSVDIFITVAGESILLLMETVKAAMKIDYPYKKIYILDDYGNPEYKRVAERYGCGYFAREDHSHAKAGNLNYALHQTSGDLILTLDADHAPQPQIVNILIGYFKFPLIGFVQTKQDFEVPVGDPFGNRDRIFYNVMQTGKDTDNAAFSCGSGVIYRRKALEEIGGFSTWNLVEDVHTSMLLHGRGWRSIYYNYPLTKGSAPADIYGVYRQRRQWAADSLRILFWDNPFRRKGLTFKQKLQYFHLGYVYLVAAFVMPLFFFTPIWALLTNNFVLDAPVRSYVIQRFPYFVAMSIAYGILNYPTPYMRAFQIWTGLFPPFIHATWIALRYRKKKPSYQVTVKPVFKIKKRNPWIAILPQNGIIFLLLFSVTYAFVVGVQKWEFYLLNFIWSMWSIWTMSGICLAAVKKHKWLTEKAQKGRIALSFFSRIKELLFTVILCILIMLFFAMADMSIVDQTLQSFRLKILSAFRIEKPVSTMPKEAPASPEASESNLKGISEKSETPSFEPSFMEERGEIENREYWVVHVVSVMTEEQAMFYKQRLLAAGFPAYSIRARVKEVEWIRVRVGFFRNEGEALKAREEINKRFIPRRHYWITKVSTKEVESLLGR
ncbi:MAG: glycosyltransferase family 2 protein [Thermodesulfobacteriota bacterium]